MLSLTDGSDRRRRIELNEKLKLALTTTLQLLQESWIHMFQGRTKTLMGNTYVILNIFIAALELGFYILLLLFSILI